MNYNINPLIKYIPGEDYSHIVLKARGIDNIPAYLNANDNCQYCYTSLDNIREAANVILEGIKNNSSFFIQVDSDNDGITSAAIMYNYIKKVNPEAKIQYRMHTGKQHGIIPSTVPDGIDIVLIPDAGSNQYEEHQELKERGMEIVVIDHHEAPEYSKDAIVVNNQLSERYPNKSLSGAGVVYKLCQALDDYQGVKYADEFLDLAPETGQSTY